MEQPLQHHKETDELMRDGVRDLNDSHLVGAPVALASSDAHMAEREGSCAPNLEVGAMNGGAVLKRKRGRPAKGAPKTTPLYRQQQKKEEEDEEDVCFICFDGGSLVLCDRRGCPKAYHPACIKREESFFHSKAKWNCGWHICSACRKASHYMCYTCTFSLCKGCIQNADFVCVRGNKGLCGICMKTIMLIENSARGNKEMCEVDFDDKSSWEYLFKVYWMFLKGKLSLTLDELLRAKNPWRSAAPMNGKVETPNELYHVKDDKGSGSENSCIDTESNNLTNNKSRRQPKLLSKGNHFERMISGGDNNMLPECSKWASKELLEFVAHMKNGDTSLLSQFDVQTLLLEYVKKNNLRDPQQKCQIICDTRLVNLFGKARLGHIEMLKLLESHFLIKDSDPAENTLRAGIIDALASEGEGIANDNKQSIVVNDKRCTTHKKDDVLLPKDNPDVYAAINAHNINMIYLRRSLLENLTEDAEKIHETVVGSFVRIRISSSDKKQEMYRLVQVIGTSKVAEPYKIGTRTTDIVLEILNLNRKEVISIDEISNQEFSEDECKRLRQSIKYGLSKRLSVGEIMDKALTLKAIRVNDLLDAEISRLNHLRDRASEKGHRKELRECVEKLQLLNSPEERQRRLREIPEVHSDPNLDLMFESDEDAGESGERKQDWNIKPKYPAFDRKERGATLNDDGSRIQDSPTSREPNENIGTRKNHINPNDTAIDDSTNVVVRSEASCIALDISSPHPSTGMEQQFNDFVNDKSWHYQDPTGKIQGPFTMLQLYKWNASGHFPPDLRIWRIDEKRDNGILLTDALSRKGSKNVTLPYECQLLASGASVTLDNRNNTQDGKRNATGNDIHTDNQINEQNKEEKVDDTCTQSNSKDESVRSNGWHDQPHAYPSQQSTVFLDKLKENPSDKLNEGREIEGKPEDNGNYGPNRTSEGQSNSGQSCQKHSDSEENSGQSSEQNWGHPHVNSSSSCFTTSTHVPVTKTSPHKLGFDLHSPPPDPALIESTWQAIIGEPTDFSSLVDVDESVSDLLAEVEAMESLGGMESATSMLKCGEELSGGSKTGCLSFADGLSLGLDAGKGDALSSTGDLHLQSQSTASGEPLQQADVHHQRISGGRSSRGSEVEVGAKNISVSGYQWEPGSENTHIVPSTSTWGMATDTTWSLGSENTTLGWGAMDQGNANMGWGVGHSAVQENRSTNSHTSAVTPSFGGSQTRYGNDRFSVPKDRGFHGHGRESGFSRGRTMWNRQPLSGFGNGGSHRPPPKGQRVCKFYESGYCKKGASCSYLHP